ncbi:MAG: hypothetical protein JJT94_00565 [Bernardetiaceae bacterium]|nr:hypothetical protein [Bernardetiaceae bacterium]
MITMALGIGLLAIFFIAMSIRLYTKKDGEFRGTCASQNPFLRKEGADCGFCGKKVDDCPNSK